MADTLESESFAGTPHTLGALLDACSEVHHPRTHAREREEFGEAWCSRPIGSGAINAAMLFSGPR